MKKQIVPLRNVPVAIANAPIAQAMIVPAMKIAAKMALPAAANAVKMLLAEVIAVKSNPRNIDTVKGPVFYGAFLIIYL